MSAIACHLVLFSAAYLVIESLWVPSNEQRALVLTLEHTPLDGINDTQLNAEETINDVAINKQSSIPQVEPSAVPNIRSPNLVPSKEIDLQPQAPNSVEPSQTPLEAKEAINPKELAEQEAVESEPYVQASKLSESLLDAQVDQALRLVDAIEQSSLISSIDAELLVPDFQTAASLNKEVNDHLVETVPISGKQEKMLNRKIKYWTENLDRLESLQEPLTWKSKGQEYVAKFSRVPANGEMEMDKVSVEISTERNGQKLTTSMKMKKLAFSNFAQFVHQWDPNVAIHDDEMDGRFHSNSGIYVDANRKTQPVFHSKVTTSAYRVNMLQAGSRENIFRGGIETGVKRIKMPKPSLNFAIGTQIPQENIVTFEQNTRIVFQENGNYLWQTDGEDGPMQARKIGPKPLYLIAASGKTLSVSGRVKGMVMLYSPRRITIEGDLSYVNPLRTAAKGDVDPGDILGLVSGGNIVVAGKDIIGPGDLEIHASMYAKRNFVIKNYMTRNNGTLRIFGSVTAGSMTATEPRYATKIVFDPRLEDMRAPGFPVTDRYEVTALDLEWQASTLATPEITPYQDSEPDQQ